MKLTPGVRLGPYEIVAPIGAGGMGEVYRAVDTRLGRTVAVKVLPAEFEADAKLKIRFEHEAKAISALNHPHICSLFDVGDSFLVMEYCEGKTLSERIAGGPLPIEQVIEYGIQVAEALDQAHRAGIIHRDLKPSNIMLTKSGIKLLDFGLARTIPPLSSVDDKTVMKPVSEKGMLIGTRQYMAPETLEGAEADARSDIFALGALLYELTTGKHHGSRPMLESRPSTPAALERIVRSCLMTDPEERLQSARDVAIALRWVAETGTDKPSQGSGRARGGAVAAAALVAGLVAGAGAVWLMPVEESNAVLEAEIRQFSLAGPPSVSPDGRSLAFQAPDRDGRLALWLRALDTGETRRVANAQLSGAGFASVAPAWSPDSRSLLFAGEGRLNRLSVDSGDIEPLLAVSSFAGATVNGEGTLLISDGDRIMRVAGQSAHPLTGVDRSRGERSHRSPSFLPDGDRYLFSALTATDNAIYLTSISNPAPRLLLRCETAAAFVNSHVICASSGRLLAYEFDSANASVGEPKEIAEGVASTGRNRAWFSASSNGLLVYTKGALFGRPSQLTWFDRSGRQLDVLGPVSNYFDPALSHDGTRVAVRQSDEASGIRGRIAIYDVARKVQTILPTGADGDVATPVWANDDRSLYFTSGSDGVYDIYRLPMTGGTRERIATSRERKYITDVSHDERQALLTIHVEMGVAALRGVLISSGTFVPVGDETENQASGKFSPDGKWIAYTAIEKNRSEVFIASFPELTSKVRVSSNGGMTPQWSRDGRKVYYYEPAGAIVEADVTITESVRLGETRVLFTTPVKPSTNQQFVVSADGSRFLVNVPASAGDPVFAIVQNWPGRMR